MKTAISHVSHHDMKHARPANFGQLNSALVRGDLEAAQTAFSAISESTGPAAMAAKRREGFDAVGTAIASGDVDAAKKALADFRAGNLSPSEQPAATDPGAETANAVQPEPVPSTEQIIALLSTSGSTTEVMA